MCPESYSLNPLCWVESAMCPDSATVRPGVIKDRIKMRTEARKKELILKAFPESKPRSRMTGSLGTHSGARQSSVSTSANMQGEGQKWLRWQIQATVKFTQTPHPQRLRTDLIRGKKAFYSKPQALIWFLFLDHVPKSLEAKQILGNIYGALSKNQKLDCVNNGGPPHRSLVR